MSSRLSQAVAAGFVLLAAFGLVQWAWFDHFSLYGLFAVSLASVCALAYVQRAQPGEEWPLGRQQEPFPARDRSAFPSKARLALGALGLVCVVFAYDHAQRNESFSVICLLIGAALCWKPLIDVRPRPVPLAWLGILSLLVMAAAAAFRFYKAGAVPLGMIHYDEDLVYTFSREIILGKREIFNTGANDGQFPYWANAAALHFFGNNIVGFRMSPIFSGFITVGLIALLGREIGGGRLGLIAGGFSSMALWAVAFSRAEYLIASSLMPVIACLWLLLWGLRQGRPLALALAGFCFGTSFSVYNAGKALPLLVAILVAAIWWREKDSRRPLKWAAVPFFGGMVIALAPLILWAVHSPQEAHANFFAKMNQDWIVGQDIISAPNFLARLTIFASRVIPNFQACMWLFPGGETNIDGFFLPGQPLLDPVLLFMVLAGMATCLVRFKKPAYVLLMCWWFLSFAGEVITTLQYAPTARRIMLNMPATMLMGSVGLLTLFELVTQEMKTAWANRLALVAGLCFFGWYASANWNAYFVVLNQDINYLALTHANYVNGIRAIQKENDQSPVYLINFRKTNADNWLVSDDLVNNRDNNLFLDLIPQRTCQLGSDYFLGGGLFGALEQMPAQFPDKVPRDPLIVLTPFHYYLEPLLQKLGGEKVEEVMPAMSTTGPSWTDFGFAPHEGPVDRMYRLRNFDRAKLEAVRARYSFPYVSEELVPPASIGTRDSLSAEYFNSPAMFAALDDYEAHPRRWKTGKQYPFTMPDIYFWSGLNYVAQIPMRLRASWTLDVPSSGYYSLGAAANLYTTLRVDGNRVFRFRPESTENLFAAEYGELGSPVFLKAGPHRLDLEQLELTWNPIRMQAIRLVWQRPGGQMETLPLDNLEPQPFGGPLSR